MYRPPNNSSGSRRRWRAAAWIAAGSAVALGLIKLAAHEPARVSKSGSLATPQQNASRAFSSSSVLAERVQDPASRTQQRLEALLFSIASEPDQIRSSELMDALELQLTREDFPVLLNLLQRRDPSPAIRNLERRLLRRWSEQDIHAAANWVEKMPSDSERANDLTLIATSWASQDFAAGRAWVDTLPEPGERTVALTSLASEMVRIDPRQALESALGLPETGERADLFARAAREWAATDPASAVAWAAQVEDASMRTRFLAEIATNMADHDPSAAVRALDLLSPGKARDDATVGVLQRWTESDPEQAAAWVRTFPEGSLQATAYGELVRLWSEASLEKTGQWLNGLTPGLGRDSATRAYVGKLALESPAVAAQWAATIENAELRVEGMEALAELWMRNEPAVAKAWIQKTALPAASKSRLLALDATR